MERTIKLTCWNIEHLGHPLSNLQNEQSMRRLKGISEQIKLMDPDVLCISEAPPDPREIQNWFDLPESQGGLNGDYVVAVIDGTIELLKESARSPLQTLGRLYATKGTQWIWFALKKDFYEKYFLRIQSPTTWRSFTGLSKWTVHYWGQFNSDQHEHYRHPQTLILNIEGKEMEIIGVHLKSKINQNRQFTDPDKKHLTEEYVREAIKTRIKLTTEAYDIRMYIDQRFEMEESPRIIVCGDLNDGPGREFFERKYLFFDLLSNIQGDVFFASRFLNHALFDYADHLRWTTQFRDYVEQWAIDNYQDYKRVFSPIDPTRFQLIDHILFTQEFVNRETPGPKVKSKAGFIEHLIHERVNSSLTRSLRTSDHRPVSVLVTY